MCGICGIASTRGTADLGRLAAMSGLQKADALRRQGFFRHEAVTKLLDEHVAGKQDWSRQLWGLLAFTLWFDRRQNPPNAPGNASLGAFVR